MSQFNDFTKAILCLQKDINELQRSLGNKHDPDLLLQFKHAFELQQSIKDYVERYDSFSYEGNSI